VDNHANNSPQYKAAERTVRRNGAFISHVFASHLFEFARVKGVQLFDTKEAHVVLPGVQDRQLLRASPRTKLIVKRSLQRLSDIYGHS
jgi:hypothetical protein